MLKEAPPLTGDGAPAIRFWCFGFVWDLELRVWCSSAVRHKSRSN